MLSVIIPTYNRPQFLERALASVRAQDHADVEILVVDDGDGEGLAMALGLADPRIRSWISGQAGQVGARNQAVRAALGQVLVWLDDDDWWADAGHLRAMASAVETSGGVACSSGLMVFEDQHMVVSSQMPFVAGATLASLQHDNTLWVSGLAYPRHLHATHGEFDARLPYYWDWDWYLRLANASVPFVTSQSHAVRCSARPDNVSSAGNAPARQSELDVLAARHGLGSLKLKNHADIARGQQV